jgi:hypothetical protein
MVVSPQFAFMAKTLTSGVLGQLAAAHAEYGHTGPDWSVFFYGTWLAPLAAEWIGSQISRSRVSVASRS